MKRNNLTTAVVAAIAGVAGFASLANAVNLNADGVGQVLIYPYYTVNKSQNTNISVVNTSDVGKAVKVRFLEGYNSREVLDFNLFLSPHDVWTAGLSQTSDTGGAQIMTRDHSCIDTLPTLPYAFSTFAFDGSLAPAQPYDGGPKTLDRTREGYVEIIAMGDIIAGSDLDAETTHVQTGVADAGTPTCGSPVGNDTLAAADLVPPTSGLFGAGAIVNVGQGTFFSYNADAIEGFTDKTLYTSAGDLTPSLQQANSVIAAPGARAFVFANNGNLLTADYTRGLDAVSAVFMSDAIYNEYFNDGDFGASSDWIVTFPTKRFYVDKLLYAGPITAPFAEKFGNTVAGQSIVQLGITTYDREELNSVTNIPRCPSPVNPVTCFAQSPSLSHEVNVLSFVNASTATPTTSTVFGSTLFKTVTTVGNDGWANIDLASGDGGHVLGGGVSPTAGPVSISGLPVTGFYANNVINANANPGMLANYSGVWRHRAHRSCTFATANADTTCS